MVEKSTRTIWPPFAAFYAQSMLVNSTSAIASITRVGEVLQHISKSEAVDPLEDIHEADVLDELQNIVVQAAALSRYFWPVRKGHDWRGLDLRRRFEVSEASPLKSRDLRNELEHFDERLDQYLEEGIVGHIIPQYIGPEPEPQQVPLHIFRAYYFDVGIFHLLGKRHEIVPIAREVHRIHRRLTGAEETPNGANADA
jgi:hypothetical protein